MALTVVEAARPDMHMFGGNVRIFDVTFDSSYPTDGEPLTPANLGMESVYAVIPAGLATNAAGTLAVGVTYDHAAQKLLAVETGGTLATPFAEVGNTESLAGYIVRLVVVGR
jgi:hypothetical protein